MKRSQELIQVCGIDVLITRKKIRNLNLRVSVPDGDVKVSAPFLCSDERIYKFISQKLDWIKNSQNHIRNLKLRGEIKLPPKFLSGEEHYFFGKRFALLVFKNSLSNSVEINQDKIELYVKGQSNFSQRQKILDDFYRKNLRAIIPDLIAKYEEKIGVKVAEFGIKKMKTRWGTCNIVDRRIWLNLELAKSSLDFLESIVVHEMTHLIEKNHNKNFYNLMDGFMPSWRLCQSNNPYIK